MMKIEGTPKEIADFIDGLQKSAGFIPCDSNGYHMKNVKEKNDN